MRVLLADDSVLILERLQEMVGLHKQAVIVGSYMDGTQTLEALKMLKPDLAIVDIKMPGLTGLEVLHEIRKEDKALKFMILTFHAPDHYRQQAIQSGVDYFFNKADDFDKVSLVLSEMILKEKNDKIAELSSS